MQRLRMPTPAARHDQESIPVSSPPQAPPHHKSKQPQQNMPHHNRTANVSQLVAANVSQLDAANVSRLAVVPPAVPLTANVSQRAGVLGPGRGLARFHKSRAAFSLVSPFSQS